VEPSYTRRTAWTCCQQIVAMVSVQEWEAPALLDLVRRAYPYHDLTPELFRSVVEMLSGRYPGTAYRELRPRLAWDRVHDRLAALPGSRLLAMRNGERSPTGAALAPTWRTADAAGGAGRGVCVRDQGGRRLYAGVQHLAGTGGDRRAGDRQPGRPATCHGCRSGGASSPGATTTWASCTGAFRREIARRATTEEEGNVVEWLTDEYCLDRNSARNAVAYVRHQVEVLGAISSDRTVIAELFADPVGDLRLVIHSCFGSRVNSLWALALTSAFREALVSQPEVQVNDDAILFRFLETDASRRSTWCGRWTGRSAERVLAELPARRCLGRSSG